MRSNPEIHYWYDSVVWRACVETHKQCALSTGESEYYALVKGGSTALGMQSLLSDLGMELPSLVESDSNSAKRTVSRIGLGKAKRI